MPQNPGSSINTQQVLFHIRQLRESTTDPNTPPITCQLGFGDGEITNLWLWAAEAIYARGFVLHVFDTQFQPGPLRAAKEVPLPPL